MNEPTVITTVRNAEREYAKQRLGVLVGAIIDAVRESEPNGIPNGILYAAMMSVTDIHEYTAIIDALKNVGMVEERFNVLHAGDRINGING